MTVRPADKAARVVAKEDRLARESRETGTLQKPQRAPQQARRKCRIFD